MAAVVPCYYWNGARHHRLLLLRLLVFCLFAARPAAAFVVPQQQQQQPQQGRMVIGRTTTTPSWTSSTTALYGVRRWFHRKLWPNAQPDSQCKEIALPPGSLGWPWLGRNYNAGNTRDGPERLYFDASRRVDHVPVWKLYMLGTPCVAVSGGDRVKHVFAQEFDTVGVELSPEEQLRRQKQQKLPAVFSRDNIAYERNPQQHATLRRLVGAGMSGPALQDAVPVLVQSAEAVVDRMLNETEPIVFHDSSVDYTLDFVQRQLLGIDERLLATAADRQRFRTALEDWLQGALSIVPFLVRPFPWITKRLKSYKARVFLQSVIEQKIDTLLEHGPDTSTVSKMLFALDDNDDNNDTNDNGSVHQKTKLTRTQVIDNALFLVAAGAETSSSTMTLTMLLLGLHPDKYQRLVEEQQAFSEGTEEDDFLEQLNQSPYLEAVLKEAMRMGPVSGGFPRRVNETLILEQGPSPLHASSSDKASASRGGSCPVQIPKGWVVFPTIRLTHQLDPVTWNGQDFSHMDPYQGFVPERWLDDTTAPKDDYLPFGGGPRYCLGANLAMLEMKILLATVARRVSSFQLVHYPTTSKKPPRRPIQWCSNSIVPRPADGALMEIRSTTTTASTTKQSGNNNTAVQSQPNATTTSVDGRS